MKLIDGWQAKLPKLWSVRLSLIAALASSVEVGFGFWANGKPSWVAVAAVIVSLSAAAARIVAQPKVSRHD